MQKNFLVIWSFSDGECHVRNALCDLEIFYLKNYQWKLLIQFLVQKQQKTNFLFLHPQ